MIYKLPDREDSFRLSDSPGPAGRVGQENELVFDEVDHAL